MLEIIDKSKCSGCHACASICPKNCIVMVSDSEGFLYPQIDTSKCVNCGLCEKSCPIITQKATNKTEIDISAYAAYAKNEEIRLNSSSGGLFTEIATYVINNGGVVFGAAFNDDFSVSHRMVDTVEGLSIFRGSKYVQSTIGNTYSEAKSILKEGKLVLFTGTPCQIGGLYSYLGKDYDNLITQDIICHGVPSPVVWQKYKKYQEINNSAKINSVSFRNKDSGWKSYSIVLGFNNDKEYRRKSGDDLFMKSFLSDLCLRPSCYNCSFKTKIRQSNITLADFWGIQYIKPELNDNKGLSLVIVSSKKGQMLIDAIKENIVSEKTDIDGAIKYNPSAIKSVQKPKKRAAFMESMSKKGFIKTTNKFFGGNLIIKMKKLIKKVLS